MSDKQRSKSKKYGAEFRKAKKASQNEDKQLAFSGQTVHH